MQQAVNLNLILDQVAKDKGIDRTRLVEILDEAIVSAAKRHFGADIVVASDGERKDWDKGRALYLKATGVESPLPFDPDADDR